MDSYTSSLPEKKSKNHATPASGEVIVCPQCGRAHVYIKELHWMGLNTSMAETAQNKRWKLCILFKGVYFTLDRGRANLEVFSKPVMQA